MNLGSGVQLQLQFLAEKESKSSPPIPDVDCKTWGNPRGERSTQSVLVPRVYKVGAEFKLLPCRLNMNAESEHDVGTHRVPSKEPTVLAL